MKDAENESKMKEHGKRLGKKKPSRQALASVVSLDLGA
jgi:hypothetical protein